MKAVIQERYGGAEKLQLVDVPKPTVKENEVLIEIHATNVASGDMRVNTLSVPTILKPIMRLVFGWKGPRHKIRGVTAAGVIVEVGQNVMTHQVGDRVYFINSMKAGCLAEFIALKESAVMAKIPASMSFIQAAPLAFGAMSAYHFIHDKTVHPGDEVLIYGASGSVGSYALQLAKHVGATVTAVSSAKNHSYLIELGADHVIDYQTTDFRSQDKLYDVIFDSVMKISKRSCKSVLKPTGRYLSILSPTKELTSRLEAINEIIEQGQLTTLIDSVFPLEQYKEAHDVTYSGHKVGNVVIQIQ